MFRTQIVRRFIGDRPFFLDPEGGGRCMSRTGRLWVHHLTTRLSRSTGVANPIPGKKNLTRRLASRLFSCLVFLFIFPTRRGGTYRSLIRLGDSECSCFWNAPTILLLVIFPSLSNHFCITLSSFDQPCSPSASTYTLTATTWSLLAIFALSSESTRNG